MEPQEPHIPSPSSEAAPKRGRLLPLLFKIGGGFVVAVLVLILGAAVALRIPQVQTKLITYLTDLTEEKTGFRVTIGKVDLNFYDALYLTNVVVYDLEGRRMIELPQTAVDFTVSRLVRREVALDNIISRDGTVRIITSKKGHNVNISLFFEKLSKWLSPDTARSKNPAPFSIYSLAVSDFQLIISNEGKDSIANGFDYNHIRLTGITGVLENFRTKGDTLELNLLGLKGYDPHVDWRLHNLKGFFRMTRHDMMMAPMHLRVGHSYLADSLRFEYANKNSLGNFVNEVSIKANLKKSRIDYRDLALFAPAMRKMSDSIRITRGRVTGKVGDIRIAQMAATFGGQSEIIGNVHMVGLPHLDTTQMDIALRPSYIEPADIKKYTPASSHAYFDRLGPTDLEGTFVGTIHDFAAKGGVYGRNGTFQTDMKMSVRGVEKSTYSGTFSAQNLALGTLLDVPDRVGMVTGKGNIEGHGFSLKAAKLALKADLDRIDLKGYSYRNVHTDATLALSQFDGNMSVRDSNLIATANGVVDLSQRRKFFDVEVNLDRANLKRLQWTRDDVSLTGRAYVNGAGSDADDAEGIIRVDNGAIDYKGKHLDLNDIEFETWFEAEKRSLRLASDFVSGSLEGDFTFRTLAKDLEAGLNDYGRLFNNRLALKNNKAVYAKQQYQAALLLDLKQISPILKLFVPGVQVAPHTRIEADLYKTTNLLLQGQINAGYVAYGESVFDAVTIDLATSKKLTEPNVLASATISSSSQRFGNLMTKDLNIEGVWGGQNIEFSAGASQDNDSNYVRLHGNLGFSPGLITTRLDRADIRLLDSAWNVSPYNRIVYDGNKVIIDSLSFATTNQRVDVFGTAGPQMSDTLHMGIDSLSASVVKAFLDGNYSGKATASVDLAGALSKASSIAGYLQVDNFVRNGLPLGDIQASIVPQLSTGTLDVNVTISNDAQPLLRGKGVLRPASLDDQMDLDFRLTQVPINLMEPLFVGLASNWQGKATGRLNLRGRFSEPVLTGSTYIRDGGITIDYLKTRYFFSDTVRLRKGNISATGAVLRDGQGHTAVLTRAEVYHRYFKNFRIDMEGDVNGLQLLGTSYKDSKLYYGSAYGSGQLSIKGPVGDIVIAATLKTEKGTRLFLPLQTALATNTAKQSYIHFVSSPDDDVNRRDSLARASKDSAAQVRRTVQMNGLRLAFNIELTPDAYGEIIFDKQTGDAVTANGYGRMKLNIDTRGDFSMVGKYNIQRGTYKFSFANVINKTFAIKDGSSITWSGDPGSGVLDIQARYMANVSFVPLTIGLLSGKSPADSIKISDEAKRRYPVFVDMNLTGPMLTPSITLGVEIPNQYPSLLAPYVTSLEGLIANNEQELNKQVFSILLLRSLSPTGLNSYASANNGVGGNLSELLSNQISNWLSEVNKNLEVGINLGGFNQQSLDNLQVRLSYTALDGRLRVTRNGGFTNTASQTTAASLAGDWTLEYNLTRDGKLRAKVFHRTNQTLANNGVGLNNLGATTAQGASLLHTQSFSTLRELLPWLYRKRKPTPPKVEPPTQTGQPTAARVEKG